MDMKEIAALSEERSESQNAHRPSFPQFPKPPPQVGYFLSRPKGEEPQVDPGNLVEDFSPPPEDMHLLPAPG
jgi:hypothetical protein